MALAKNWYKLLKGGERVVDDKIIKTHGLLDDYPLSTLDNSLIICATPNPDQHLFNVYQSHLDFIIVNRSMEPQDKHFYEIIVGEFSQKPHFDLDFLLNQDGYLCVPGPDGKSVCYKSVDVLEILIKAIIKTLQEVGVILNLETDILIYSSHSVDKQSYHLVINNWYHKSNLEARGFYDTVVNKIPTELNNGKIIDCSVYSKTQQFRILESTKINAFRPKTLNETFIFEGQTIKHKYPVDIDTLPEEQREKQFYLLKMEESLVTKVWNCNILPEFVKEEKKIKNTTTTTLDFQLTPQIATFALGKLPDGNAYKITKITEGLIILQRNRPSNCIICNRIHESENVFLRINNNGQIYFFCRRGTGSVWIGYLPLDILHNLKTQENQLVAENMINTRLTEYKTEIGENGIPNLKIELNYLKAEINKNDLPNIKIEPNYFKEKKEIWETNIDVRKLASMNIDIYNDEPSVKNMNKACENGHLDIIKEMYKKKVVPTTDSMDKAVRNGHLEVVKYLYSIGIAPSSEIIEDAVENGNIEMVKFLLDINIPPTRYSLNISAKKSFFDILKLLIKNGIKPNNITLEKAIESESLDIIKYLLESGIVPDKKNIDKIKKIGNGMILGLFPENV